MLQDDLDTASKVYSCATQALRANREHDLKCTRFTRPHGEEKIRIESVGVKPESRAIHTAQSSPSSPNSTCRQRSCHGEIPVDTRYHLRGLTNVQLVSRSGRTLREGHQGLLHFLLEALKPLTDSYDSLPPSLHPESCVSAFLYCSVPPWPSFLKIQKHQSTR